MVSCVSISESLEHCCISYRGVIKDALVYTKCEKLRMHWLTLSSSSKLYLLWQHQGSASFLFSKQTNPFAGRHLVDWVKILIAMVFRQKLALILVAFEKPSEILHASMARQNKEHSQTQLTQKCVDQIPLNLQARNLVYLHP